MDLLRSPGEVVASLLHSMQVALRNTDTTHRQLTDLQPKRQTSYGEHHGISRVYHMDIIIFGNQPSGPVTIIFSRKETEKTGTFVN